MRGYDCSCYMEYPNKYHQNKNGTWKCIDKYEKCEDWKPKSIYSCKTHCRKKRSRRMNSKQYAEQMVNRCAEMIVEALKNMSIEDINMYQIGYEKGKADAIEELGKTLCDELDKGYVFMNKHQILHFVEQLKEQK